MLRLHPTEDGSFTLYHEGLEEIYHSRRGAIQESKHVFIEAGLVYLFNQKKQINILEVGFGTGLNALLTLAYLHQNPTNSAYYCGLETLAIPLELWQALSYPIQMNQPHLEAYFNKMHSSAWDEEILLLQNFLFSKKLESVASYTSATLFDVVYFDAFAPNRQAEMWQASIFEHLYLMMSEGAVLVTYCAKGQVRRDLQQVGFRVERLAGPAGKREMLRAIK